MPDYFARSRHFTPRKTGEASALGDLESAVMDVVWSYPGSLSVSEVHSTLEETRRGAYTTVKTTLERLAQKGILRQLRDGRAYTYEAAVSKTELERRIVAQALDVLVEQFPSAVASFFVNPTLGVSEKHLALLAHAIEAMEEEGKDKTGGA